MGDVDQKLTAHQNLFELIPQRPPMVLIDNLLKADEQEYVSTLTVREDNIFLVNGVLTEAGLIENIAQTSAAGFGWGYVSTHRPIPIGFIGAVQNLTIFLLPAVGEKLKTVVTPAHKVMNISVVHGKIFKDDQIIAQCDMKLFLQE